MVTGQLLLRGHKLCWLAGAPAVTGVGRQHLWVTAQRLRFAIRRCQGEIVFAAAQATGGVFSFELLRAVETETAVGLGWFYRHRWWGGEFL